MIVTTSIVRFALVTAAHHFLLNVVPFGGRRSQQALSAFVAVVEQTPLSQLEIDAILFRCLLVLSRHVSNWPSALIERYATESLTLDDSVGAFVRSAYKLFRYRCIRTRAIQQAIDLVNTRYADSSLTPATLAASVGMRLATFDVAFRRETGLSPTEHVRLVRMERAAMLLVATNKRVKEVWIDVGYNHHSNFDHDFKRYFGCSPRDYRRIPSEALPMLLSDSHRSDMASRSAHEILKNRPKVLIVDDDEGTRTVVGQYLTLEGFPTCVASTGQDGIRQSLDNSPDVIILDYHLEDMSGLQMLKALRTMKLEKAPAVAIFTADWEVKQQCNEIRALDGTVISKLCDLETIRDFVLSLSAKGSQRSPQDHNGCDDS